MPLPGKKLKTGPVKKASVGIIDTIGTRTTYLGLHSAAREGRLEDLRDIIKKGIHPHGRDSRHYTPTMVAAENGNLNILEYYHSSDLEKDREIGVNLLKEQDSKFINKYSHDEDDMASHFKPKSRIELYRELSVRECDGFNGYRGWTPLHIASRKGFKDVVRYLLEKGHADSTEGERFTAESVALNDEIRDLF
jgi:ankyrin repeat protein